MQLLLQVTACGLQQEFRYWLVSFILDNKYNIIQAKLHLLLCGIYAVVMSSVVIYVYGTCNCCMTSFITF